MAWHPAHDDSEKCLHCGRRFVDGALVGALLALMFAVFMEILKGAK